MSACTYMCMCECVCGFFSLRTRKVSFSICSWKSWECCGASWFPFTLVPLQCRFSPTKSTCTRQSRHNIVLPRCYNTTPLDIHYVVLKRMGFFSFSVLAHFFLYDFVEYAFIFLLHQQEMWERSTHTRSQTAGCVGLGLQKWMCAACFIVVPNIMS